MLYKIQWFSTLMFFIFYLFNYNCLTFAYKRLYEIYQNWNPKLFNIYAISHLCYYFMVYLRSHSFYSNNTNDFFCLNITKACSLESNKTFFSRFMLIIIASTYKIISIIYIDKFIIIRYAFVTGCVMMKCNHHLQLSK